MPLAAFASPKSASYRSRTVKRDRTEEPLPFVVETAPNELRASFRVGDSWCRNRMLQLRSGLRMGASRCEFEPSFSFSVEQPPSELELVVSRGAILETETDEGDEFERGGNTLQLSRARYAQTLRVRAAGDSPMECVSVSLTEPRLLELLGVSELPEAFRRVIDSSEGHALVSRAITPKLFGLLEEITNADPKGPSRLLWYEAKSMELLASMTDELLATPPTEAISALEIERLERVERRIVERLDIAPKLADLARVAAWSETALKAKFRARYGTSIFAYLRDARMREAQRLLLSRTSVTEVAQRVGYSNPSKFAAAFRRQFGMAPSSLERPIRPQRR